MPDWNVPIDGDTENVTVPWGVIELPPSLSVTLAVHEVWLFTAVGLQVTLVESLLRKA
jgi:hypothetical protein